MTWYQDDTYGDPFKRDWKHWRRNKDERSLVGDEKTRNVGVVHPK